MANAPILVAEGDEEIEVDYDSDGFPIPSESSKVIDPLPPIDHSAVSVYRLYNFIIPEILHASLLPPTRLITHRSTATSMTSTLRYLLSQNRRSLT